MIFSFSNYLIITLFLIQRTFQWVEKTYEPQPLLGLTQENPALDLLAVPYLDTQLCDKSVTKGNLPGFSYVRDFLHIITEWKLLASLNCDGLYYVQVQETTLNAGSITVLAQFQIFLQISEGRIWTHYLLVKRVGHMKAFLKTHSPWAWFANVKVDGRMEKGNIV